MGDDLYSITFPSLNDEITFFNDVEEWMGRLAFFQDDLVLQAGKDIDVACKAAEIVSAEGTKDRELDYEIDD